MGLEVGVYKGPYQLDRFEVGRQQWIGVEILNMFDTGSWPIITKLMVELADSELE